MNTDTVSGGNVPVPFQRTLALLAMAALAAYVLACRPGFSPDGTKVLVSAVGGTQKQGHLLAYNRKSGEWMPLLSVSRSSANHEVPIISSNWSNDGREVIAAWASKEDEITVTVLPLGGVTPTRIFRIDGVSEAMSTLMVPPVLCQRHAFFGGDRLTVLNLETGDTAEQPLPGNESTNAPKRAISLMGQGGGVYYLMGGATNLEAGRLDLSDLKHPRPIPMLQLRGAEADSAPFLALSRASSRLAVTRGDADDQRLEIYHGSRLEKTLRFGATNSGVFLGNLVWSLDGKTLYAAAFKPVLPGPMAKVIHAGYGALQKVGVKAVEPAPRDLEVLVCEIPMDGGTIRETPLFRTSTAHDRTYFALYQIAMSPDGGTIAASAGISETDEGTGPADRALYLIDLTRAKRPVSRIPIPWKAVSPAGVE